MHNSMYYLYNIHTEKNIYFHHTKFLTWVGIEQATHSAADKSYYTRPVMPATRVHVLHEFLFY